MAKFICAISASNIRKPIAYTVSLGASLVWQVCIAYACSAKLSPQDGSIFIFLFTSLGLISFWDLGFGYSLASFINERQILNKPDQNPSSENILGSAGFGLAAVYGYTRKRFLRAFIVAIGASGFFLYASYLRTNNFNLDTVLCGLIIAGSYTIKSPLDSLLLIFESTNRVHIGKSISGICLIISSIMVILLSACQTLSLITLSLVFLLMNIFMLSSSIFLLKKDTEKVFRLSTPVECYSIPDYISLNKKRRTSFFLPILLAYASSFLTLPMAFAVGTTTQIPMLNNLLLFGKIISFPCAMITSIYRSNYGRLESILLKFKLVKKLTLYSFFSTLILISALLIAYFERHTFASKFGLAWMGDIPTDWLIIYFSNLVLIAVSAPYMQLTWFNADQRISHLMIANILLDVLLSLTLGIRFGISGILASTLIAGCLTVYLYSFNKLRPMIKQI